MEEKIFIVFFTNNIEKIFHTLFFLES